jgi:hypothetical protein
MSAVNTDLSRFAVFINSKVAVYPSTTKSDVVIPFAANLADHDPLKAMKVSIVDVLFSNVFYNIRDRVNKLKVVDVYAAGRGCVASYKIQEIAFANGHYDYDSFTQDAETKSGTRTTVTFTIPGPATITIPIYSGFGSVYPTFATDEVPAVNYSLQLAKVFFQTPSLGDMYQGVANTGTTSPDGISYIYAGKYLVVDEETAGLMKLLGFYNGDVAPAPLIPGTDLRGYGVPIFHRSVVGAVEYSFDGITFGNASNDTFRALYPSVVSDFTGLDDLYIHCEQLRTQFLSGVSKSALQPNDVVCVVPINVPYGEKMSFIPQFPLESFLINTNITQLRFRMTNSNNEELDFQGINWSLTMFCEEVDDEARINAENQPIGNLPNTFFAGGVNPNMAMQQRLSLNAKKRNRFGVM